jgi:hypothetical protein
MSSITRITRPSPVDLDALEQDVVGSLQQLPPVQMQPQPDIGRLSADAVLEQFNIAAKSVEAMGDEVRKRIAALETALKECDADLRLLADAAAAIRDKGKHAHAEIERTSAVSKDIRGIVDQIKAKLT